MTRRDKLRRAGILCLHCIRNLAFYEAWYEAGEPGKSDQFWINVNSNFIDTAILEWCKLFGDRNGKHAYRVVVDDPDAFMIELLAKLGLTAAEFSDYVSELKKYRDKFLAHLDDEPGYTVPHINNARESALLLHKWLQEQEKGKDTFLNLPPEADKFYLHFLELGKERYS